MRAGKVRKQTNCRQSVSYRRIYRGALIAAALACAAIVPIGGAGAAFGQSTSISTSQLTISTNTTKTHLDDEITSVVFTDKVALTLLEGQTLKPVFVSKQDGAILNLGDGTEETTGQVWRITSNNPTWTGRTNVLTGNTLEFASWAANPGGAWAENNVGAFATTSLYNGATLRLPARAVGPLGIPQPGEVKIGKLVTSARADTPNQDDAIVEVGAEQTLTVENGVDVNPSVGLTKRGTGTLRLLANGTESITIDLDSGDTTVEDDFVSFDLGKLNIVAGTVEIDDGSVDVEDVDIVASNIFVGKDAELDIDSTKTIFLKGAEGDAVFKAADGSTIDVYVDEDGGTSFVSTTYNTYIDIGEATLDITSSVKGQKAPKSLVVFSTQDVGQTYYNADKITVLDDILGKRYVVLDEELSADQLVLVLVDSTKFADVAPRGNAKSVATALDKLIESDNYTLDEYAILFDLEDRLDSVSFGSASGEIYASSIGFSYMNNLTTTQTLFDHLRNNALAAYSGDTSVAPMDYGAARRSGAANQAPGNYPITGGASGGNFDSGPLYYNTDSNSYGPGVVPITSQPQLTNGVYNGETYSGVDDGSGSYNLGWRPQKSALATMRGQAAYGDPGTLIYSAWFAALGSNNEARVHKQYYGYDAKQFGFLAGLDLFGSCDCRFGAYYGYQHNELKNLSRLGKLKTNEHTIGLYHQFGDENIYNIGTLRGGYGRYRSSREISLDGILDDVFDENANAKYDAWSAGATFERGANFNAQPFTLSPYAQLDYNFFLRRKIHETSPTNSPYALAIGKSNYHSLRGQIGGRIALDMYPGEQQIRIVASAAYIHEFLNAMYGKTWVSFQGLPDAPRFAIYGNSLGRDWALLGLGADWAPIPALDLFIKGNYLVNKYTRLPYTSAGLKFRW